MYSLYSTGKNGVSLATIVAQFIMVPVAKASGWLSKRSWAGTKRTMLVAFLTLPVRGTVPPGGVVAVLAVTVATWVMGVAKSLHRKQNAEQDIHSVLCHCSL